MTTDKKLEILRDTARMAIDLDTPPHPMLHQVVANLADTVLAQREAMRRVLVFVVSEGLVEMDEPMCEVVAEVFSLSFMKSVPMCIEMGIDPDRSAEDWYDQYRQR